MKTMALWCAGGLMVGVLTPAWGWFDRVDDFEDYSPGPIAGQGEWFAYEDAVAVVADPADPSNQVLAVSAVSTRTYRPASILNGTVRMMFLRFRFGSQINCSFGLSDVDGPREFSDFEVQLDLGNAVEELRIHNDNQFDVLTTLQSNQWYNLWVWVDNAADLTWVYLNEANDADAVPADRQANELGEAVFVFRTGAGGSMTRFFVKTGGGNSNNAGPLYLDDIYIENRPALSLFNPTTPGPPYFREIEPAGGMVNLVITNLIPAVHHRVEWTADPTSTNWNEAATFVASSGSTNWSVSAAEPRCYRVMTVP